VKPKNILVFGESEDIIVARVADFGFSTVGLESDIQVAVSTPWVAPEVGNRDGYTLEQAKQTARQGPKPEEREPRCRLAS
jgi:hypothetical protein